jgi:archaellum biogenesis protein FlaJ (TadC family)
MKYSQARNLVEEVRREDITYSLALRRLIPDQTQVGAESTFCLRLAEAIRNGRTRQEFYREEAYKFASSLNYG